MAIEFLKGQPTSVPKVMHEEVMEKGILPVEDDGAPVSPTENKVVVEKKILLAPEDGNERAEMILEVIKGIVKRNNASDFAGGGHPGAKAVTAELGWRVDQKEVGQVWLKHRQSILNPEKVT